MNNSLEVQGLSKRYRHSLALNDVSFVLPSGYIMGFIGSNGAGKTTTIKAILKMIKYDAGRVKLFGKESPDPDNEHIGIVMDETYFPDNWTLHNIEKLISPFYSEWDSELYAHYLDRFSLEPKKSVKTLSRGMKVKLQIAVALSHNARMLILDEPTSGLDPFARDEICDLIREFIVDESKSVFFSTHITSDLEKIADYITLIEKGHIVFTETKDALLERYTRVTGGLGDINAEQKGLIIGYREHSTGFEGLLATADLPKLPEQVFRERASLEEVIINLNKGAIVE